MTVMAIIIVALSGVLLWVVTTLNRRPAHNKSMRNLNSLVERKSRILSPSEKKFFDSLLEALGDDFYVFTKVAILDVVRVQSTAGVFGRSRVRKLLRDQHFDFVLCKKRDLSIFGVVELENFESSVAAEQRRHRENMINLLSKAINLRTFYFDVRQDYGGVDIRRLVTGEAFRVVENRENTRHSKSQFTIENTSYSAYAKQCSCPKCQGEVVTKIAVKGKHIGEKFLMCRRYPDCNYKVALRDRDVVEKLRREATVEADQRVRPNLSSWAK